MSRYVRYGLVALTVALTALTAHAYAKRPVILWSFFHFDGREFVSGKPGDPLAPFVAVRDGLLPVVQTREEKIEAVQLPTGTGALAGICYVQSFGGKLKPAGGYHPVPLLGIPIVSADGKKLQTETDTDGFFVTVLPPGSYRVGNQGVEVQVENGRTKLLPLRVGKRMVD